MALLFSVRNVLFCSAVESYQSFDLDLA